MNQSTYEKRLADLLRRERMYIYSNTRRGDSALSRLLADKVPGKLQSSLDAAFSGAFALVFEKGTVIIEKSFRPYEAKQRFRVSEATARIFGDREAFSVFSKRAEAAGAVNLAVSGAAGLGLGFLGIGLPDIALFTALMLKNVYETALSYGYDYEGLQERCFILRLIEASLSRGERLSAVNRELDYFIENGAFPEDIPMEALIKRASACLSGELLYMKFLQGIPVAGAIGGAGDAVYMQRIGSFARMKYEKRFLIDFARHS